jgi:hypothetical protein
MNQAEPTRAKRRSLWVALAAVVLLGIGIYAIGAGPNAEPKSEKTLYLMSSIPLKWGEGDLKDLAQGESAPARFFDAAASRYNVVDVDQLEKFDAPKNATLVLVQPRLLTPAENVALDKWVREGGNLILFADPALQWESRFPLGDSRRPLFTSLLSPLLNHWGVQLALPVKEDSNSVEIDERMIETISRGFWMQHPHVERIPDCHSDRSALLVECRIGKGRALMFADADMLQDRFMSDGLIGEDANRSLVFDLIDRVVSKQKIEGIMWENLGA